MIQKKVMAFDRAQKDFLDYPNRQMFLDTHMKGISLGLFKRSKFSREEASRYMKWRSGPFFKSSNNSQIKKGACKDSSRLFNQRSLIYPKKDISSYNPILRYVSRRPRLSDTVVVSEAPDSVLVIPHPSLYDF